MSACTYFHFNIFADHFLPFSQALNLSVLNRQPPFFSESIPDSSIMNTFLSGATFGAALAVSGVYQPRVIISQLTLQDWHMIEAFLTATASSTYAGRSISVRRSGPANALEDCWSPPLTASTDSVLNLGMPPTSDYSADTTATS